MFADNEMAVIYFLFLGIISKNWLNFAWSIRWRNKETWSSIFFYNRVWRLSI